MLSNAMEKASSAAADTPLPTAPSRQLGAGEHVYPDKLDAGLLRISGVCILATVMAILDVTVVSVAQRTFIELFGSSQAVVGWTMTGYTLALAVRRATPGDLSAQLAWALGQEGPAVVVLDAQLVAARPTR